MTKNYDLIYRVPATAKNDQLHTSTCSVAVLPEQRDIQVQLLDNFPSHSWTRLNPGEAGQQRLKVAVYES